MKKNLIVFFLVFAGLLLFPDAGGRWTWHTNLTRQIAKITMKLEKTNLSKAKTGVFSFSYPDESSIKMKDCFGHIYNCLFSRSNGLLKTEIYNEKDNSLLLELQYNSDKMPVFFKLNLKILDSDPDEFMEGRYAFDNGLLGDIQYQFPPARKDNEYHLVLKDPFMHKFYLPAGAAPGSTEKLDLNIQDNSKWDKYIRSLEYRYDDRGRLVKKLFTGEYAEYFEYTYEGNKISVLQFGTHGDGYGNTYVLCEYLFEVELNPDNTIDRIVCYQCNEPLNFEKSLRELYGMSEYSGKSDRKFYKYYTIIFEYNEREYFYPYGLIPAFVEATGFFGYRMFESLYDLRE